MKSFTLASSSSSSSSSSSKKSNSELTDPTTTNASSLSLSSMNASQPWVQQLSYHLFAPEYLPGNINVLINGALFLGTIYGFHRWGRWLAA